MYKLIWKKEVIDEVDNKDEANILIQEYNRAYKGGVSMKYEKDIEVLTCYCGNEIESGNFCSKECSKHYFNEIT